MFCFIIPRLCVLFTLTSLFASESKKYTQTNPQSCEEDCCIPSYVITECSHCHLKVAGLNCAEYRFIFWIFINAGITFSVSELTCCNMIFYMEILAT